MEQYKEAEIPFLISRLELIGKHHREVLDKIISKPRSDEVPNLQSILHQLISEETKIRNALRFLGVIEWRKI